MRQNFTSGILRDEAAMLNALSESHWSITSIEWSICFLLVTGYPQPPDYVTDTETQREYKHPKMKSLDHMKSIEEKRLGRYAFSPNQHPPNGICKLDSIDRRGAKSHRWLF